MILFDCIYVNNGGGKVLLDLLVERVNKLRLNIQFLFDDRISNSYDSDQFVIPPIYIKAGEHSRINYYKLNSEKFKKIFAFGNVPPPIKLNIPVYTYLHNVLYLEKRKHVNLFISLKIYLKEFYIKRVKKNTDFWIVQTNLVKSKLALKWNISYDKILSIPFYNDEINKTVNNSNLTKNTITYIYVSNGESYKNHLRLFEAFEKFSFNKKNIELKVTIANEYSKIINEIEKYNLKGIPIHNLGLLCKNDIESIYSTVDFVLFPSLFESFGLGLIEAAQNNLPVIASDCDFVNEIIIPSKVFDPLDTFSICQALEYSYENNLNSAKLIVENKINDLLEIFKN